MKKVLLALILAGMVAVLSGCMESASEGRTLNAIVRYFDGTSEMLVIRSVEYGASGFAHLILPDGRKMAVGCNNVIIVEEDD